MDIKDFFGDKNPEDMTVEELEQFIRKLHEEIKAAAQARPTRSKSKKKDKTIEDLIAESERLLGTRIK